MEKTLGCYDSKNGCYVFYCSCCDKFIFQSLGCNSRICSCRGKRYTDQWSNSLSKAMFPVPHRHIVMSVPDKLWEYLDNWDFHVHWNIYPRFKDDPDYGNPQVIPPRGSKFKEYKMTKKELSDFKKEINKIKHLW